MRVFNEINPLRDILSQHKIEKKSIGLVPTMGALHAGHLTLVSESIKECDITVCSIYVNPTQFNNPSDLEKYPNTIDNDLALLEKVGCDIVFCPQNQSMYPDGNTIAFDFGVLGKVMEGEFRKGHFSGVATVVSKFFNIVQPDVAYFGQKDLQQFAIINQLVENLLFNTKLKCVLTVREDNGLALSSRNMRLSDNGRKEAMIFSASLLFAKHELKKGRSIPDIKSKIKLKFASSIAELEYFEIVNKNTFESIAVFTDDISIAACIAGYVDGVRLIDNMLLNE